MSMNINKIKQQKQRNIAAPRDRFISMVAVVMDDK